LEGTEASWDKNNREKLGIIDWKKELKGTEFG